MSSPTPPPQPRGFPAPCWTHDETVALIVAYREKWDSLGRRNLRSTDWDDVAASVSHQSASASASDSTPKTSAQCRHKIEKLRRRFRAEKQRCANFKGRVFSSWDLFDLMASIELTASEPVVASKSSHRKKKNPKSAEFDPSYDFDPDYGSKTLANVVLGLSAVNAAKSERKLDTAGSLGSKRGIKLAYEDDEDAIDAANQRAKLRHSRIARDFNFAHNPEDDDDDDDIAYPVKSLGTRNLVSLELRPRKFSRMLDSDFDHYPDDDYRESSRFRSDNYNSRVEKRARLPGKSIRGIDSALAVKVSSSIRLLVDELLQVEKMKMEMVKDIEKMRMRMEVKRSEMIIKSEQMIIGTLIEAIYEEDKNNSGKNSDSLE